MIRMIKHFLDWLFDKTPSKTTGNELGYLRLGFFSGLVFAALFAISKLIHHFTFGMNNIFIKSVLMLVIVVLASMEVIAVIAFFYNILHFFDRHKEIEDDNNKK